MAFYLTEIGDALFTRAVGVLKRSMICDEIVSLNEEVTGTLRISCLPTFAKLHIFPGYQNLNLIILMWILFWIYSNLKSHQ
ncbi:hypothetical protein J4734_25845 [Klebsiella pneumoniae]|uniref:LysR family transcriptional regulator n=1 Tax=Klebsiella pneumoniae TaxID=573 RepID=A0A939NSR0_KLEPN|nr:hypothetical protein [Klebsiella pneumoniae]